MKITKLIISFCLLALTLSLSAQVTYNMGNFTVNDCEGVLLDSEVGNSDNPTGYDHNENYTFTICVPNASSVTINFEIFELEKASSGNVKLDILSIYAGADRNAPLIGEYTGDQNPGSITITGECVTIHFVSDASVNAEGWRMTWVFDPPDPVPPVINPIPNASCDDTQVIIEFDKGVVCNQINLNNFTFSGPAGALSAVTPLNCNNDTTTRVLLDFNPALTRSGTYTVTCDVVYFDICGRPFQFTLSATFQIVDCPLIVEIIGDTTVCEGDCIDLFADVEGGDFNNYQYTWSPAGPNASINRVCPTAQFTEYIVTVTDGNSTPSSDTIRVEVLPRPTMPPNFSICRFAADTTITADPPGGFWGGPGMNNQGRFRPRNAGAGTHNITYFAPNGCPSTMQITVHPVNTPNLYPVCVGLDSNLINGTPAGGTWAGSQYITPTGYFDAQVVGDYTVTYTEPNFGCQKTTLVRVVDSIEVPTRDSILVCVNQGNFQLDFSPVGGFWQGQGVNGAGVFNPGAAGPGKHLLWYTINGCSDTTSVEVFDINAGADTVLCPTNPAIALNSGSPAGGIWSGPGVTANIDSSVYTFNTPFFGGMDTIVTLTYELAGCTDTRIMYVVNTQVEDRVFEICDYDSIALIPTASIATYPSGGVWFGPDFQNDTLDTRNKGVGSYYIYYEFDNNSCLDSMEVVIKPQPFASTPAATDTVCPKEADFNLNATPTGGIWSGLGIVDANQGTFSPTSIGFSGNFEVLYNFNGCYDTTNVLVRVPVLNISGIAPVYCFENGRTVQLIGTPRPGYFQGPGVNSTNGTFDPGVAGPGYHAIEYIFGSGDCEYRDTTYVTVQEPITIDSLVYNDTICFGDRTSIRAFISGGRELQSSYNLVWTPSDVGGTPFNITVGPDTTTTYTLTVNDKATNYCSYTTSATATIVVNPKIEWNYSTGAPVCYGDSNYVNAYQVSPNPLEFKWQKRDGTEFSGDYFEAPAGLYDIDIVDQNTGCSISDRVDLPQYDYLEAEILKVPMDDCISILNPNVHIVNASVGADYGFWNMGDTSGVFPMEPGVNFDYTYADTGSYVISLFVANGGGLCFDSVSVPLCVQKISKVFLPNTFTPNRDGDNDSWPTGGFNEFGNWIPLGFNVRDFEVIIFDRWGHVVFDSELTPDVPWNGNYLNRDVQSCKPGVYTYVAKLTYERFEIKTEMGTITLLR